MKYSEILQDVLDSKLVRFKVDGYFSPYIKMESNGTFLTESHELYTPHQRDYKLETWEVKPEKQEEIYANLIGAQNSPHGKHAEFEIISGDVNSNTKYKLVPVDEEINPPCDGLIATQMEQNSINRDNEHYKQGQWDMWNEITKRMVTKGLAVYGSEVKYILEGLKPE